MLGALNRKRDLETQILEMESREIKRGERKGEGLFKLPYHVFLQNN